MGSRSVNNNNNSAYLKSGAHIYAKHHLNRRERLNKTDPRCYWWSGVLVISLDGEVAEGAT